LAILKLLADQADAAGRVGDLVEVEIVTAIALLAEGDEPGARCSLNRALEFGETGGFMWVFVIESEELRDLLRETVAGDEHRDYAARILEVLKGIPQSP
jgi:hypothetical protein